MNLDAWESDRYFVIAENGVSNGWIAGWSLFDRQGSPAISFDVKELPKLNQENLSHALDMENWKDTIDYDQNNPGILDKVNHIDSLAFRSDLEKFFWMNVTRVPICASYLAGCAKVQPQTILELGTGGDSAHSTGMFLYWLYASEVANPKLVSVDRHPLSHVWLRYRSYPIWNFIQGDSITAMKNLISRQMPLPDAYDMIFIDSSHTYPHTLKEIQQASYMTDAILLDDTTVDQVKKSLDEFLYVNPYWLRIDLASGVTLIERHDRIYSP